MGYERRTITVTTRASRHNSPRDHRDDALHDLLAAEINLLIKDKKYEPIEPELDGWMGY